MSDDVIEVEELMVPRGSLWGFAWRVDEYDLADFQSGECQIRASLTTTEVLDTLPVQLDGQIVSITIPSATSSAWPFSQAAWGIELIRSADGERIRVKQGSMLIDTEVVR